MPEVKSFEVQAQELEELYEKWETMSFELEKAKLFNVSSSVDINEFVATSTRLRNSAGNCLGSQVIDIERYQAIMDQLDREL